MAETKTEMKLFAVPADWAQPEYALGETVYDLNDRPHNPAWPGCVVGLRWDACDQVWSYFVHWDNCSADLTAEQLTREPWERVYPEFRPGPSVPLSSQTLVDDFDPFLDSDDLP